MNIQNNNKTHAKSNKRHTFFNIILLFLIYNNDVMMTSSCNVIPSMRPSVSRPVPNGSDGKALSRPNG